MTLEKLARWAVPGALLMGGAWFASGIVAFVMSGGQGLGDVGEPRFYLIEGLHGIGEIGLLAGLAGLHLHHQYLYRRLGRVGFWSTFVGTALLVLATLVGITVVAVTGDVNVLFGLLFAAGLIGWLVGFPLLGIAAVRAKLMGGWVGWLLIAFFPMIIVGFLVLDWYGVGGVVVGLMWLAIGYALWMQERAGIGVEAGAPVAGGG